MEKQELLLHFCFYSNGEYPPVSVFLHHPSFFLRCLGWNILWTNILMGGLLIIYTFTGGAKAVAYTQQIQIVIIFAGMFMVGYMVVHLLPGNMGLSDALHIGGKAGKLNVITSGRDEQVFNGTTDIISGAG